MMNETQGIPSVMCPRCGVRIPLSGIFSEEGSTVSEWMRGFDGNWTMAVYSGHSCPGCGTRCTVSMMCREIEDITVEENPE